MSWRILISSQIFVSGRLLFLGNQICFDANNHYQKKDCFNKHLSVWINILTLKLKVCSTGNRIKHGKKQIKKGFEEAEIQHINSPTRHICFLCRHLHFRRPFPLFLRALPSGKSRATCTLGIDLISAQCATCRKGFNCKFSVFKKFPKVFFLKSIYLWGPLKKYRTIWDFP